MRLICDRSLADPLAADLRSQLAVVDRAVRGRRHRRWAPVDAGEAMDLLARGAADAVVARPAIHDRGVGPLIELARLTGHHLVLLWGPDGAPAGARTVGEMVACRRHGGVDGGDLVRLAQVLAGLPPAALERWSGHPARLLRWVGWAWRACPHCACGAGPRGGRCSGCGAAIGGIA